MIDQTQNIKKEIINSLIITTKYFHPVVSSLIIPRLLRLNPFSQALHLADKEECGPNKMSVYNMAQVEYSLGSPPIW